MRVYWHDEALAHDTGSGMFDQPPTPLIEVPELHAENPERIRNIRSILHNGPIYTMDPRLPQVSALAVADDLIAGGVDVREGEVDTVGHERLDLDGRCVLPGFTDAHVHFLDWALERTWLDLHGCRSLAEACAAVGAAADGDGWLRGKGWLEATWPDGPPHRQALDEVTGERPAALWAHDHHTLW